MPEMKFFPDNISKTTTNKKEKNSDLEMKNDQRENEQPQNPFFDLSKDDVFSAPKDGI
ncbi:hypothetical protein [Defluviitalea saccharophila]|uniref:Uncharacterized protein n=1 Tax=Defluviitalea saccharophila TaxID=879970 RepID=A0ABZ2Y6I1_9FIRM